MESSLENRVVIVTGASSGIGAATARLLSSLGCRLTLAARSTDRIEKLARELGSDTLAVRTDVTHAPDVANMVELTLGRFGRIDALLANAGIYIPGDFASGDPDAFANLIDVNVNGVLRCAHAVLPVMKRQRSGDILVTSSISGAIDIHWEPVYSASKHAVHTLVHTLRRQVTVDGIRLGLIAPGRVANELWGITDAKEIDQQVSERASLRSEDVAEAIAFMLSRPTHVTIRDLVILPQNQDL